MNKRNECIQLINLQLFQSNPVLGTTSDGNLIVNTTFISQQVIPVATATINPSASYVPPLAVASNRIMTITIPEGTSPGSILTVLTPQGSQMQVPVPNDVKPGAVLTVSY